MRRKGMKVVCFRCQGKGWTKFLWRFRRTCADCRGHGIVILQPKVVD